MMNEKSVVNIETESSWHGLFGGLHRWQRSAACELAEEPLTAEQMVVQSLWTVLSLTLWTGPAVGASNSYNSVNQIWAFLAF